MAVAALELGLGQLPLASPGVAKVFPTTPTYTHPLEGIDDLTLHSGEPNKR